MADQDKQSITGNPRLRKTVRERRRRLSAAEQLQASACMCGQVCRHSLFRNARRIAVYLANDGEIDPAGIMQLAWEQGKEVYLPVLVPVGADRLWFARFRPDTPLVLNRFGIPEPHPRHWQPVKPLALDLIITPLVAFDDHGNRLGMGGGYYDRTFEFMNRRQHWHKPRLLGTAYAFQQVARLDARPWDIPLTAIATENEITVY